MDESKGRHFQRSFESRWHDAISCYHKANRIAVESGCSGGPSQDGAETARSPAEENWTEYRPIRRRRALHCPSAVQVMSRREPRGNPDNLGPRGRTCRSKGHAARAQHATIGSIMASY
jgi:hypothetical protein